MDSTPPPPSFSPSPPPPVFPASPMMRPRPSRGWMVFALVLLVLLGFSMLMNLGSLMSDFFTVSDVRSGGPRLEEVVLEYRGGPNKILVLPIEGIITGDPRDRGTHSLVEVVQAQLRRASRDKDVKAVLLKVDSPGGEVLASDEIAQALENFQKQSQKPVIVSMGSLAASGGYYVAAPCQWIVANELTITGSIGVIMQGFNYRGLMDKVGLRPEVYKSGEFKDMLSGSRDPETISAAERAMLQSLIDETYEKFKSVVREGRAFARDQNGESGRGLATDWTRYADGRILSGNEAFKLGFVDELGNFETAVQRAEKIAGIEEATLIEYQQHYDLADLLGIFGKGPERGVKIDWGVEIPKLDAGRLYFLSPTYLR